ncbi:uncharacterized protein YggU (UPF0235/DUF167 family) [Pedobacter sp. UYEF25]
MKVESAKEQVEICKGKKSERDIVLIRNKTRPFLKNLQR